MNAALIMEALVVEAHAWRIEFDSANGKNREPIALIKEPVNLLAFAEPIEFSDALTDTREFTNLLGDRQTIPADVRKPFLLLCLPPGSGLAADMETRMEAWIMEATSAPIHPVRAGLRTSRVIWSSDRAIIYAAQEQMSDAIDAVLRFTVAARLAASLENEMNAIWPVLDEHARLTHAVSSKDQRLQPRINDATLRSTLMMSRLLRLEGSLEQVDPALTTGSKRLFAELVQQGALYERLEILEDPIEHAIDVCETANSRLTEAKFANRSFVVEQLIALFLAAELALMAYNLFVPGVHILGH
jgi:hypothetical protein